MRILVTDGMDASAVAKLRADGFEVVEQFYEPDELGAALREFDVVIIRSATKIKEPQIDAAKGGKLKVIIRAGVGVDNIAVLCFCLAERQKSKRDGKEGKCCSYFHNEV